MTTSRDVRHGLVHALELDLIGPDNAGPLAKEVLPQAPSRWYLTGFLVPVDGDETQRKDEESAEEVGSAGGDDTADDAAASEPPSAKAAWLPSSMGLSFLATPGAREARVRVEWGDYRPVARPRAGADDGGGPGPRVWEREPRNAGITFTIPEITREPVEIAVPESGGLFIAYAVRPLPLLPVDGSILPGTRSVSVFLVNRRAPVEHPDRDRGFAFQVRLDVELDAPFVARPDLRGLVSRDPDERIADLQYRDAFEYAVGHGVATAVACAPGGDCRLVRTAWIPTAEVERVVAAPVEGAELGMEALAGLGSGEEAKARLRALPELYRAWILASRQSAPTTPPRRAETAAEPP